MSVATERLAQLSALYALPAAAPAQLRALLDLLAMDPRAPSSVTDPAVAVDVHIADALTALEVEALRDASRIADLGAGAGFPGLALAVALPGAEVALIESNQRKCAFLERAAAAAGTSNAIVVCARAEAWPEGLRRHDVVTARAVGPLAVLCEFAAPLLALGGTLMAWKGAASTAERLAGDRAAAELGLEQAVVVRTAPYPGSTAHHLHMYRKTADTSSRFPRRPGVARKHPLGERP